MKYSGRFSGKDGSISLEKEGIRLGSRFLDFADVRNLRPLNHRVMIETLSGEEIEISMLGFSYDGFWEELSSLYAKRSLEALFAEEAPLMRCEDGEYDLPGERGRGIILLLPDAICVLPPDCGAIRIPLCYSDEIRLDGYLIRIRMRSGAEYCVGRMGYDTVPFAERAAKAAETVKKQRAKAISALKPEPPFRAAGIFRTEDPEHYWTAAFGKGCCAVELFTGENAATYLYRYEGSADDFLFNLEEVMEAVGTHREIINLSPEELEKNPLYRMSVARTPAVRFLRRKAAGRLIHNASHAERLAEFLG